MEDQTPWCEDCILALESWGGSGYVTQPKGFVVNGSENKVCKLHKVLYGLAPMFIRYANVNWAKD